MGVLSEEFRKIAGTKRTGALYFSSKEFGAYKVVVDLKNYDVKALLAKASMEMMER